MPSHAVFDFKTQSAGLVVGLMTILLSMSEETSEEWVDPIVTITRSLNDYDHEIHGRMTDLVAFQIPVEMDVLIPILMETDSSIKGMLPRNAVDQDLLQALEKSLPEGAQYEIHQANVGRGASGYGAVIEVVRWTADVGGASTAVWAIAKKVREILKAVSQKLEGGPSISLGAAKFLAAAELADRLGIDIFHLHGAGDMYTEAPDRSYTGLDTFWVAFRHQGRLYLYVVTANGDVRAIGDMDLEPKEYWGSGE